MCRYVLKQRFSWFGREPYRTNATDDSTEEKEKNRNRDVDKVIERADNTDRKQWRPNKDGEEKRKGKKNYTKKKWARDSKETRMDI